MWPCKLIEAHKAKICSICIKMFHLLFQENQVRYSWIFLREKIFRETYKVDTIYFTHYWRHLLTNNSNDPLRVGSSLFAIKSETRLPSQSFFKHRSRMMCITGKLWANLLVWYSRKLNRTCWDMKMKHTVKIHTGDKNVEIVKMQTNKQNSKPKISIIFSCEIWTFFEMLIEKPF